MNQSIVGLRMDRIDYQVNKLKEMALTVVTIADRNNGIDEKTGALGLYDAAKKINKEIRDEVANRFAKWLLEYNPVFGERNVEKVFRGINPVKRTANEKKIYRDYFKTVTGKKEQKIESHEKDIRQWCRIKNGIENLSEVICAQCKKSDEKKTYERKRSSSNQIEKHLCCRSYIKYDRILGYEVSTNHVQADGQNRNIDIVFLFNDSVYMGEAKEPQSNETLFRAVLESETYYHRLADKEYFIKSFEPLFPLNYKVSMNLKKAIVVGEKWFKSQIVLEPAVFELMKYLGVEAFDIEKLEEKGILEKLYINTEG